MKNRMRLEKEIIDFATKNRKYPEEIYATKQFINKIKKEVEKTNIYWSFSSKSIGLMKDEGIYIIYQGIKIKELKDFIITK